MPTYPCMSCGGNTWEKPPEGCKHSANHSPYWREQEDLRRRQAQSEGSQRSTLVENTEILPAEQGEAPKNLQERT